METDNTEFINLISMHWSYYKPGSWAECVGFGGCCRGIQTWITDIWKCSANTNDRRANLVWESEKRLLRDDVTKSPGWAGVSQKRMGRAFGAEDCKDMESWKGFHIEEKEKVGLGQSNQVRSLKWLKWTDKTKPICWKLDQRCHVNPSTLCSNWTQRNFQFSAMCHFW